MREKLTMVFAIGILAVMIPYFGTMVLTGTIGAAVSSVEELDTGKTVSLEVDGQYQVIDVEAYLKGTLPTVLEGSEDIEVWKTLAVIERTNIYKRMDGMGNIDEKDLELEYMDEEELKEVWGERKYDIYSHTVEQAILETAGETIVYDGEYIDALYHKVSVGTTVSAEELLGESVPYLTAVVSSHDVEAKDYMNLVTVSKESVQELSVMESTEHGYVRKILYNGEELSGEDAQELFDLPSLNFYVEDLGNEYRIVCLGKGHGLGMSLYGAGTLASEGKNYKDILQTYYPGTQILESVAGQVEE